MTLIRDIVNPDGSISCEVKDGPLGNSNVEAFNHRQWYLNHGDISFIAIRGGWEIDGFEARCG